MSKVLTRLLQWTLTALVVCAATAAYCKKPKVKEIYIKPTDEVTITLEPNTIFKVTMESKDGTTQKFTVKEGSNGELKIEAKNLNIDRPFTQGKRSLTIGRQVQVADPDAKKKVGEIIAKMKAAAAAYKHDEVQKYERELERMSGAGRYIFEALVAEKKEYFKQYIRRALHHQIGGLKGYLVSTLKDTKNSSVAARREAALLLEERTAHDEKLIDALHEAVKSDPAGVVKAAAARSLASFELGHPEIQEHLFAAFKKEKDEDGLVGLMRALTQLKNVAYPIYQELAKLLETHSSAKVRKAAASCMWHAPSELVVDSLLKALKGDKDAEVRAAVATRLSNTGAEDAFEPLVKALKEDKSEKVRTAAARALIGVDLEKAIPVLEKALSTERSYSAKQNISKTLDRARKRLQQRKQKQQK